MPTQAPTFQDLTVEDLAGCVKHWLEVDERSVSWLAKKIDVADSTLRFQLDERPDRLLVSTWLACFTALGRTWDDARAHLGIEASAA